MHIFANTIMDVTEQLPQDVMHVLLESLIPFNLKHLLRHPIGIGLFSLNDLNVAIHGFMLSEYVLNSERPNEINQQGHFSSKW